MSRRELPAKDVQKDGFTSDSHRDDQFTVTKNPSHARTADNSTMHIIGIGSGSSDVKAGEWQIPRRVGTYDNIH